MENRLSQHREPVLGVDVGRVIIAPGTGASDTSFLHASEDEAMETPAMASSFEVLARLNERFEGRVWIVSKAGPRIAALTERWFLHNGFFERTGIDPSHVRFCRERKQKRDHCARHHITHFVDDRMDVLRHLTGLVPWLYQFGVSIDERPDAAVEPVPSWRHAERAITATL